MNDGDLKKMFFDRDENAIKEADKKYGGYCFSVAVRILNSDPDAEECVNDAYFAAWNRIPPEDPSDLGAFLAKITRNTAVDRVRRLTAEKRGGGSITQVLSELDECCGSAEDAFEERETLRALKRFLKRLPKRDRDVFLCRYYFSYTVGEIAEKSGYEEDYVRTILSRTRKKLRKMFEGEGLI